MDVSLPWAQALFPANFPLASNSDYGARPAPVLHNGHFISGQAFFCKNFSVSVYKSATLSESAVSFAPFLACKRQCPALWLIDNRINERFSCGDLCQLFLPVFKALLRQAIDQICRPARENGSCFFQCDKGFFCTMLAAKNFSPSSSRLCIPRDNG